MANDKFDDLITTTLQCYLPTMYEQIFSCRPFFFWLRDKAKVQLQGGRSIVVPLMYQPNNTIMSYQNYDTLNTKPQKGFTAAEYNWKQVAASISLCGAEEAMNRSKAEAIDILDAKVTQTRESLIEWLDQMMILSDGTGNNGKDPCGLEGIIGTGELGGIDGNDPNCAWWRSFVDDAGYSAAKAEGLDPAVAAPPKVLNMKDLGNAIDCISCGNDTPDLILMSKELYQGYRAQLQPQLIQQNSKMADMGFPNLMYMGTTIMWDAYVPEDTVYLLNSKYLMLKCMEGRWFSNTEFVRPHNQDSRVALIFLMFELCTCERRRLGKLCNRIPAC